MKERLFTREDTGLLRKELRNNATDAERKLWQMLRNKQVNGLKFRRQHSIGSYVMDFYCPQLSLCIEVDGEPHNRFDMALHDEERTCFLNAQHITVLRYSSEVVFYHPSAIITSILNFEKHPYLRTGYIKDQLIE